MTNDPTRDAFEAAYKLTDKTANFQRTADNGRDYYFDNERDAWMWWQAATLAAQRQPLTDNEIEEMWDAQLFNITDFYLARDLVREVEAAHEIKA